MNASPNVEPAWKTYPKIILFLLPAAAAWGFTCVMLLPRLKELWVQTGFDDPNAHGLIVGFVGWQPHFILIGLALVIALALLEWCSGFWRRHRRQVLGFCAFLVNAAVLFFITAMFTYALAAIFR